MLRSWIVFRPLSLALALAVLGGLSPARAQEKAGHDAHGEAPGGHAAPVYEAEMHDESGKVVKKTYDLRSMDDTTALLAGLKEGHIHGLHIQQAPTITELFSLGFDLAVWTLIVFLLLLFVLSRIAWPKMIAGLQKREEHIRGALDEAQKARDEAHTLRLSLQKEMDSAHEKVRQMLDEARAGAQATTDEMIVKARTEIDHERDRLRREIESETDRALQKIWTQAATIATEAAGKALGRGISEDSHRRLIDEAIDELRSVATQGNGHA